jgi:hypothetical protein
MFDRYLFGLSPAVALALVTVTGALSFALLRARAGFVVVDRGRLARGASWVVVVATLFAVPTIVVDVVAPFPRSMNVPPPGSLLFYPVIGVAAEVAFHLLPLAVLVWLGQLGARGAEVTHRQRRAYFGLVACVEPAFHLIVGWGDAPRWVLAYVGLHLFAFSLAQLYAFRRYGLLAMYAFRIVYYLHWHVLWGYARLDLLF